MAVPIQYYTTTKLQVPFENKANDYPIAGERVGNNSGQPIIFNGRNLREYLSAYIESSLVGTAKYMPYADKVALDPAFEATLVSYFDELVIMTRTNAALAVVCADRFFEISCLRYWELIANSGSKNLAVCLLEEILRLVDKWEKCRKKKIHKGTPYYFLSYAYREMGDIDSAFAAAFKAIAEDKRNSKAIFNDDRYKSSPAFKYITIVDSKDNFLYETVISLRKLLSEYILSYQALNAAFTINDVDNKFLRNNASGIQDLAFVFVYTLEQIKKYREQLHTLPNNDFYKIRNLNHLFNLCLIIDKLLQRKFKRKFTYYTRPHTHNMYISDGVVLLFEAKGWIPTLTGGARSNPKSIISQTTPRISEELAEYAAELVLSPSILTFNGTAVAVPLNSEMLHLLLAYKIRNEGAHSLEKQTILVSKYEELVRHLMIALFTVIDAL